MISMIYNLVGSLIRYIMLTFTLVGISMLIRAGEGGAVATGAFEIYISLYLFVVFGVFTYLVISRVALAIANVVRQWAIPALREPMTEALSTKQGSGYWYKVWPQRLLGWNLGAGDAALCAV
jgi:hypothetical protein